MPVLEGCKQIGAAGANRDWCLFNRVRVSFIIGSIILILDEGNNRSSGLLCEYVIESYALEKSMLIDIQRAPFETAVALRLIKDLALRSMKRGKLTFPIRIC